MTPPVLDRPTPTASTLPLRIVAVQPQPPSDETRDELLVRSEGAIPRWLEPVLLRLQELGRLPTDWNGRGSQRLSGDDAGQALMFLGQVMRDHMPTPWIGLLGSGGVQLAWHIEGLEIEVVFDRARGERGVLVADEENEREIPIGPSLAEMAQVGERLAPYFEPPTA